MPDRENEALVRENEALVRENEALRRALRMLHGLANLVRAADEPDAAAYAVLTAITAGVGLGYHRAMIFVPSPVDADVLLGAAAVGPGDREEADRVWRAIEAEAPTLDTLYEAGVRISREAPGALARRVRSARVHRRGPGARSPVALAEAGLVFAAGDDDLEGLLHLPTTIAAPMRGQAGLEGVLLADHRFAEHAPGLDETSRTVFGLAADHAGRALEAARRFARVAAHAAFDALTGLDARRVGLELLDAGVVRARAGGPPLGFVLIDLDDFKRVNDQHGHPVGDALLGAVGEKLRASLRGDERAFRFGGEELGVVIDAADASEARREAERLRLALRSVRVPVGSDELGVTCSLGAASTDAHPSREALVRAADEALLRAKRAGKDRVESA